MKGQAAPPRAADAAQKAWTRASTTSSTSPFTLDDRADDALRHHTTRAARDAAFRRPPPHGSSARPSLPPVDQLSLDLTRRVVHRAARHVRRPMEPARRGSDDGSRRGPHIGNAPSPTAIWDGGCQAFNVAVLRQAMVTRGFTAESLQAAADVAHGTMYNALAGRRVRLSTAGRILGALALTPPRFLLSHLAADIG